MSHHPRMELPHHKHPGPPLVSMEAAQRILACLLPGQKAPVYVVSMHKGFTLTLSPELGEEASLVGVYTSSIWLSDLHEDCEHVARAMAANRIEERWARMIVGARM